MVNQETEDVRLTRKALRRQTLETVLTRFDVEIMGLDPASRKNKYEKMLESPFRFFRGSAFLFYYDATHMPLAFHTAAERPVWIQGDLHFENFGAFQNEKGELVFDVNDFDEGYPGSYLYDVLRMAVSIVLFCRQNQMESSIEEEAILAYLKAYRKQLKAFLKGEENPISLRFTADHTTGPVRKMLKKLDKKRRLDFINRLSEGTQSKERRFIQNEEMIPVSIQQRALLDEGWNSYMKSIPSQDRKEKAFYQVKDMAVKKGSGTASIGLDRFYVMIEGDKEDHAHDDVILEVKEARAPIPAYFLPYLENFWDKVTHQGKRVVMTQQAMHHAPDPFLGYMILDGKDYYVRERSPFKKKVKSGDLKNGTDLLQTVSLMGRITAKMHARADADHVEWFSYQSEKEILKAIGKDGKAFYQQVSNWALFYAGQVEEDYQLFCQWTNSWRNL